MSKLRLKKEIEGLSHEQLVSLILEAYDARREIRDYLEYFINPDPDKVHDTYRAKAEKELARVRRGRSRCRVTVLRTLATEIRTFGLTTADVIDFDFLLAEKLTHLWRARMASDTHVRACASIVTRSMIYAQENEAFDLWQRAYARLNAQIGPGTILSEAIDEAVSKAALKIK